MNSIALSHWNKFIYDNPDTYPKSYGKYLVCRKDGKVHWETFNGTGWAYNGKEIRFWAVIHSPTVEDLKIANQNSETLKVCSKCHKHLNSLFDCNISCRQFKTITIKLNHNK